MQWNKENEMGSGGYKVNVLNTHLLIICLVSSRFAITRLW